VRIIQYRDDNGSRRVGMVTEDGGHVNPVDGAATVYELACEAADGGGGLAEAVRRRVAADRIDYDTLLREGRVLVPVDHPEPARFLVTGTGLTHLGSADARNKMHVATHGDGAPESDSMKIFRIGLTGGKPEPGRIGVQPEWFFKGVGTCIVAPGAPLPLPAFALAGAEEAEIVGLYLVDRSGRPWRIGFAIGNEYSDHVTEAQNYLYTQHSKLRACSFGPELLIGTLPNDVRGKSRVVRNGGVVWEEDFLSGEANMSHSIANLEHYHFRYDMFRRPGDLHAYFFGAAVLSYSAGVKTAPGDEFEIEVPIFGKPLRNRMELAPDEGLIAVSQL